MNPTLELCRFAIKARSSSTLRGRRPVTALSWSGLPPGTKACLIVDDRRAGPAAPKMTWSIGDLQLPPERQAAEGASPCRSTLQGSTTGSGPATRPCRRSAAPLFHKLYALDTALPDLRRPTRLRWRSDAGHILGQAELVGPTRTALSPKTCAGAAAAATQSR